MSSTPSSAPTRCSAAAELLPDATLEIVPGAPHSMYWEAPELFNQALDRFLETVHHEATVGGTVTA